MKKIFSIFAAVLFAGSMMATTLALDTLTCAAAAEKAKGGSQDSAIVKGYVTEIATAFNAKYKNVTFWMADTQDGGKVFEAYRAVCEKAEDVPPVGSLVWVKGTLTKYKTTYEMAAGCTFGILDAAKPAVNLGEKTIAEFLALKNNKDTCILTGIVADIVMDKDDNTKYNKYGNFYLVSGTDSLYIYGLLTADGKSKQFQTMGVDEGDELTLKAVYSENNGKPQASNSIYVSHTDKTPTAVINTPKEEKAVKRIQNGKLIIEKNGNKYNALGNMMR